MAKTDMKSIAIVTGAGISAESGISTFRDVTEGLWYNYNIEEVATGEALKRNPKLVNEFHNMLRAKLKDVQPNAAHEALKALEDRFDVTIITQNVDDLHERAGSTNVLHLHGELYKSRSSLDPKLIYECRDDINDNSRCEKGSRLRPHTVLFGEYPYNVDESVGAIHNCDYLLIIGTSLEISYIPQMLREVNPSAKIYYIDPKPVQVLSFFGLPVTYIKKPATEGVVEIVNKILNNGV